MANKNDLEFWVNSITNDQVISQTQINDGVNGKVILHFGRTSSYITKYFGHLPDGLIRFKREVTFINQIQEISKYKIPSLIGCDEYNLIICEEFIEGTKKFSNNYMIVEILEFIQQINSNLKISEYPIVAANSIMKMEDLIIEIKGRIEDEMTDLSADNLECLNSIQKRFKNLSSNSAELKKSELFIKDNLKLLLSPSDIGPHNMIYTEQGFKFIDFEFAGIDSSIKIGFDLVAHPDLHFSKFITQEIIDRFTILFGFKLEDMPELLYALFKIKWSLLIIKKSRKDRCLLGVTERSYISDSI